MAITIALPEENTQDERRAHLVAGIITGTLLIGILLFMILYTIITPIPAIPPPDDVIQLEIGIVPGTGGDNIVIGGGSNGNTGKPGNPPDQQASNPVANPPSGGNVTDPNSNSNVVTPAGSGQHNTQPSVNPDIEAALAAWNKNKGKASIAVGGQGNGPYTGGIGDGSGTGPGPGNGGDPGVGTPGGDPNGTATSGKNYRHITFKPEILNPTQEEGKVVVICHVNRDGEVTRTEIGVASTTVNNVLRSTASQSAYKIKFNADPSAPVDQAISIDINFTLK